MQAQHDAILAQYASSMHDLASVIAHQLESEAQAVLSRPIDVDADPEGSATCLAWFLGLEQQRATSAQSILVATVLQLRDVGIWGEERIAQFVQDETAALRGTIAENHSVYASLVRGAVMQQKTDAAMRLEEAKRVAQMHREAAYREAVARFVYPAVDRSASQQMQHAYDEAWKVFRGAEWPALALHAFAPFSVALTEDDGESQPPNADTLVTVAWDDESSMGRVLDGRRLEDACMHVTHRLTSMEALAAQCKAQVVSENEIWRARCQQAATDFHAAHPNPFAAPQSDTDTEPQNPSELEVQLPPLPLKEDEPQTFEVPTTLGSDLADMHIKARQCIERARESYGALLAYRNAWMDAWRTQKELWGAQVAAWDATPLLMGSDACHTDLQPPAIVPPSDAPQSAPELLVASIRDYFTAVANAYVASEAAAFFERREARLRALELQELMQQKEAEREAVRTKREMERAARDAAHAAKLAAKAAAERRKVLEGVQRAVAEYRSVAEGALAQVRAASELYAVQRKLAKIKQTVVDERSKASASSGSESDEQQGEEKEWAALMQQMADVDATTVEKTVAAKLQRFAELAKRESESKAKASAVRLLIADSSKSFEALQTQLTQFDASPTTTVAQLGQLANALYVRGIELNALTSTYLSSVVACSSLESRMPKDCSKDLVETLQSHLTLAVPQYAAQLQRADSLCLRFPRPFFAHQRATMLESLNNDDRKRSLAFDESWTQCVSLRATHAHQLSPALSNPAMAPVLATLLSEEEARRGRALQLVADYRQSAVSLLAASFQQCLLLLLGEFKQLCSELDAMPYVTDLRQPPQQPVVGESHKSFRQLLKPRPAVKVVDRSKAGSKTAFVVEVAEVPGRGVAATRETVMANETNAHGEAQAHAQQAVDALRQLVVERCAAVEAKCDACVRQEEQFHAGWLRNVERIRNSSS
jgi:hypothetical protein